MAWRSAELSWKPQLEVSEPSLDLDKDQELDARTRSR